MDFAALPPEVNSTLMYSGPGSGPFLAAAAAWDGVAAQLRSAASGFQSTVTSLTSQVWRGPASQAMTSAAALHISWLTATAAQAEQAAEQVKAAAAAYEGAFATTVPPSVVAANRAQLALLASTNVLGQNTAAIAANEALYAEMWAQDAAAMYGYSASSASALQLSPFTPPPQTTNPAGSAEQAAAVAQDTAGSMAQQAVSQLGAATAKTTSPSLAAALPAAAALPLAGEVPVVDLIGLNAFAVAGLIGTEIGVALSGGAWVSADASTREILNNDEQLQKVQADILAAIDLYSPLTPSRPGGPVPLPPAPTSAAIGEAVSAGNLSVPISWAANAPEIRSLAYETPTAAAPSVSLGSAGTAFGEMAVAGMAGSALAGAVNRGNRAGAAVPATRVPAPAAADMTGKDQDGAANPVTGIAAEIREFAALRDAGLISDEEYTEQKLRLLGAAATQPAERGNPTHQGGAGR